VIFMYSGLSSLVGRCTSEHLTWNSFRASCTQKISAVIQPKQRLSLVTVEFAAAYSLTACAYDDII
jgi:hypothetical protein